MDDKLKINEERENKIKEKLLDEAFKKAEMKQKKIEEKKIKDEKKYHKKSFSKMGFLLLVFAIVGIILINIIPWVYIEFTAEYGDVSLPIYNNVRETDISYQEIKNLFGLPNYIGIRINDFSMITTLVTYGFYSLIILGIAIILFSLINKICKFSFIYYTIIHFIIATASVISGTYIAISFMKFFGVFFLQYYNSNIIDLNISLLTFPAAFIIILMGFIIVNIAFTIMRMDMKILQETISDPSERSFSHYTKGGNL